jgi:hypothetical protein
VDTGAVILDGILDWHDGDMPTIAAAAYINNYGKPETAAMFDIASTIVAVTQQVSPNDDTQGSIGNLGVVVLNITAK